MLRFITLLAVAALALTMALENSAGAFAGLAALVVAVAGFGLVVAVCSELKRHA